MSAVRKCDTAMMPRGRPPNASGGSCAILKLYGWGMALRKLFSRVSRPIDEIDREKLGVFAVGRGGEPISGLGPRTRARVAGEIRSVRIVPRAGAPAIEVQVSDGSGSITAVFLGRRKIGGVTAGRKLIVQGMVMGEPGRLLMHNPLYELV